MKKLALCIGNDAYTILPKLNCCVSDATAMCNQLSSLGFDTILKINLNREEMQTRFLALLKTSIVTMLFSYTMPVMVFRQMETIFQHP